MMNTTKLILLLSLASSSFVITHPSNRIHSWHYVAGAGVLCTTLATLYGLCHWAMQPESPQSVLDKTQRVYDEYHAQYNQVLTFFSAVGPCDERMLFELVPSINRYQRHLYFLTHDIAELRKRQQRLGEYMAYDTPLHASIAQLNTQMSTLIQSLEKLEEWWNHNASFFNLHAILPEITNSMALYDQVYMTSGIEGLKTRIARIAIKEGKEYPFIAFINQVRSSIERLEHAMRSTHQFVILHAQAEAVLTQLYGMIDIVAKLPEYSHDVDRQKADQVQQELLRFERERVESEKRKARAKEEKNIIALERIFVEQRVANEKAAAIRQQADAHVAAAHLKVEEQRLKILEEQAKAARICVEQKTAHQ